MPTKSEFFRPFVPQWTYYRCPACKAAFVVVQIDRGQPFRMLNCDTAGCPAKMQFSGFHRPDQWPEDVKRAADGVFYRPTREQVKRIKAKYPVMYNHVKNGGVILRAPDDRTPAFPIATLAVAPPTSEV